MTKDKLTIRDLGVLPEKCNFKERKTNEDYTSYLDKGRTRNKLLDEIGNLDISSALARVGWLRIEDIDEGKILKVVEEFFWERGQKGKVFADLSHDILQALKDGRLQK